MSKDEVLALMKSSKSEQEWKDNCNKVKRAHNGIYPDYWYTEVILSGLFQKVTGQSPDLHVEDI